MMDFKLPTPLRNRSFKSLMTGLANVDLSYQYQLDNGVCLGGGFKYGYFDVVSPAFTNTKVTGRMEFFNPFVKVAKRNVVNEKAFFEMALNVGYNQIYTKSNQCVDPYVQNGINIEPQLGVYMWSTEYLAFGLIVSYNFIDFEFTPDNLCLDYFPGQTAQSSVGKTQVFGVGFGFFTYIPKKGQNN